ncbi:MAG TPA: hypothetical protein VM285_06415 [Polyangia bacterium]|nr:hypothetical protein [Polyangia bacterium]
MRHSLTTMMALFGAAALLLLAACGSAGANGPAGDEPVPPTAPEPATPEAVEPAAVAEGGGGDAAGLVGAWENGSCGERKYRRRVELFADGRFAAVDEVAPCPPGARCVWSGIIRWQGTWSLEGRILTITVEPAKGDRLPDVVPGSFEIIADDPVALAERTVDLVCPYRRID